MSKEPSTTLDADKIITIEEAAAITSIRPRRLRKYAAEGKIPGAYQIVPHGRWTFKQAPLVKWFGNLGK